MRVFREIVSYVNDLHGRIFWGTLGFVLTPDRTFIPYHNYLLEKKIFSMHSDVSKLTLTLIGQLSNEGKEAKH